MRGQHVVRVAGVAGLAGVSVLHAVWATGSPWPARSAHDLAEAVVGQADAVPGAFPTDLVAAGTAGAGLLAAGAFGGGSLQRGGVRLVAALFGLRAALGGEVALTVLKLPPAGPRFRTLDRRYYRPAAAALGAVLCFSTLP